MKEIVQRLMAGAAPEGLHVDGYLYLSHTEITQLPERLHVGGRLDLAYTPITQLPEGLHVGGYLDLRHTKIAQLPEGLHVGGALFLPSDFGVGVRVCQKGRMGVLLAVCSDEGYALVLHDDGSVSAGCRFFDCVPEALEHWENDEGRRAEHFTKALIATGTLVR